MYPAFVMYKSGVFTFSPAQEIFNSKIRRTDYNEASENGKYIHPIARHFHQKENNRHTEVTNSGKQIAAALFFPFH